MNVIFTKRLIKVRGVQRNTHVIKVPKVSWNKWKKVSVVLVLVRIAAPPLIVLFVLSNQEPKLESSTLSVTNACCLVVVKH